MGSWVQVFKELVRWLPLEHIRVHVIKQIVELPSKKQSYAKRKVGFEMFWALAEAKGEEGFKQEPHIIRIVMGMCTDTNWKLRKQGAQLLQAYLKPLHHMINKRK